mgnify:FL=1
MPRRVEEKSTQHSPRCACGPTPLATRATLVSAPFQPHQPTTQNSQLCWKVQTTSRHRHSCGSSRRTSTTPTACRQAGANVHANFTQNRSRFFGFLHPHARRIPSWPWGEAAAWCCVLDTRVSLGEHNPLARWPWHSGSLLLRLALCEPARTQACGGRTALVGTLSASATTPPPHPLPSHTRVSLHCG